MLYLHASQAQDKKLPIQRLNRSIQVQCGSHLAASPSTHIQPAKPFNDKNCIKDVRDLKVKAGCQQLVLVPYK